MTAAQTAFESQLSERGMLMLAMSGGDFQAWGRVRPHKARWRIDIRPIEPGWLYGFDSEKTAEGVLMYMRVKAAKERSRDVAVAPFLPKTSAANEVPRLYEKWLEFKWAQVKAGQRSPNTIREYERYARPGGEIEWWHGRYAQGISAGQLDDWALWIAGRVGSPSTVHHIVGAFSSFMTWLKRREVIDSKPEMPEVEVNEHLPTIIPPEIQAAILQKIPMAERGPFLVMAHMGPRPSEVRALDVSDYRNRHLSLTKAVQGPKASDPIGPTKNRRSRRLWTPEPVGDWIAAEIGREALLEDRPLFIHPRTGNRWSQWSLDYRWRKACKLVGVVVGLYEGTKHSWATDALARNPGSERAIQEVLGHVDRKSTEVYAKLQDAALVRVLRRGDG